MLEMILYSITIMYTPGPINITALNLGMNQKARSGMPFYLGVSLAITTLYILFGYFSQLFLRNQFMVIIGSLGTIYMLYLAYKIFKSNPQLDHKKEPVKAQVNFRDGFFMQLLNPKAIIAVMPVVTIHFPAYDIHGISILYMALIFSLLVYGAPLLYAHIGQRFKNLVLKKNWLKYINRGMALLLVYVSISTFLSHVLIYMI